MSHAESNYLLSTHISHACLAPVTLTYCLFSICLRSLPVGNLVYNKYGPDTCKVRAVLGEKCSSLQNLPLDLSERIRWVKVCWESELRRAIRSVSNARQCLAACLMRNNGSAGFISLGTIQSFSLPFRIGTQQFLFLSANQKAKSDDEIKGKIKQ